MSDGVRTGDGGRDDDGVAMSSLIRVRTREDCGQSKGIWRRGGTRCGSASALPLLGYRVGRNDACIAYVISRELGAAGPRRRRVSDLILPDWLDFKLRQARLCIYGRAATPFPKSLAVYSPCSAHPSRRPSSTLPPVPAVSPLARRSLAAITRKSSHTTSSPGMCVMSRSGRIQAREQLSDNFPNCRSARSPRTT